jgi:16S rRNA (guanine966-N2)-methyltransferase
MRIISGNYKGRRFQGKVPNGIRPTLDIVRESIFNSIHHSIEFNNATVADLCAGTGAMGIESISRGAEKCYFFDKSRKSCDYIKSSLVFFQIPTSQYQIICKDAVKSIKEIRSIDSQTKFDIIFIDPPYKEHIINDLLDIIQSDDLLNEGGIISIEYSSLSGVIPPNSFSIINKKRFGETEIIFLEKSSL